MTIINLPAGRLLIVQEILPEAACKYTEKIAVLQQSLTNVFTEAAVDGRGGVRMFLRRMLPAQRQFATRLHGMRRKFAA